ncbi:ubiquitin-conjugating enzyme/RWD-like protein [Multifurca ochricompacta]|uniref:Ubiquitin-conjugating enzyme/RWD-like protein n=1 Tax=Multifurca ochricompacta TaxID=376703 RepID=A0AAD4QR58_9AGAM|nr:ubiquitin-conjugating enzyme/RWD-like protein [Multifurca ochricompacta]
MASTTTPFVWAAPDEKDILTCAPNHGPPDSPYLGGEYHGVLLFPSEYPFKPPGIKMYTPSGRFQPDKKICFSMSDFHPGSVRPLTGLVSFMLSDEMTTARVYASRSHAWNLQQRRFREAFSEYCTPSRRPLPNMGEKERGLPATSSGLFVSPPPAARSSPTPMPKAGLGTQTPALAPKTVGVVRPRKGRAVSTTGAGDGSLGWAATWRQVVWEKWRWGVLIALAVVVSRITTSA